MDSDEIAAAAQRHGLDAALTAYPQEIAAAIELAHAQRQALAAIVRDPSDAS